MAYIAGLPLNVTNNVSVNKLTTGQFDLSAR